MRSLNGFLMIAVACVSAFAQAPGAGALPILPLPLFAPSQNTSFPPLGLGSTETMQVNVVNLAQNPANITVSTPAASCTGSISFYDSAGTPIGTSTAFTVTSGQTASATLTFGKAAIIGTRGVVRAVVQTNTPSGRVPAPCQLTSSLETFDTVSGATHVVLTNQASPYNAISGGILSGLPILTSVP